MDTVPRIQVAYADGAGGWNILTSELTGSNAAKLVQAAQYGARVLPGDFNNDGVSDLMVLPPSGEGVMTAFSNRDSTWEIAEGSSSATFMESVQRPTARVHIGDFNGDGNADAMVMVEGNGDGEDDGAHHVALSVGDGTFLVSSFKEIGNSEPAGYPVKHVLTGDHDNDGKDDIVLMTANSEGSADTQVYRSACLSTMPEPEEAQCNSPNIMNFVQHECQGQRRCQVPASRAVLGDGCPDNSEKRTFMVQAVCSAPVSPTRPYEVSDVRLRAAVLPDATLYSLKPPAADLSLGGIESGYATLPGYDVRIKVEQQTLLVMTLHGHVRGSEVGTSVSFAFFVGDQPAVTGDGLPGPM